MAINNRTVTIKNVFASNADTTIPNPPVSGQSYRNTSLTAEEVAEGWPFKEIVDSAKFNEAMYEYTTICQQLEKYGFLPWSANTDYPAGGCALGTNGNVYQAKQATGPSTTSVDPVTDTSHTYWDLFYYGNVTANRALVSNSNGKVSASSTTATEIGYVHGVTSAIQTQLNNKANNNAVVHLSGTETITGAKTIANNLNLSATANGNRHIYSNNTSITKGTAPSTNTGFDYVLRDSSNSNIAAFSGWYNSNGNIYTSLSAYTPTQGSTTHADLRVGNYASGRADVVFETPTGVANSCLDGETSSTTSDMVALKGWVNNPATATNVVHRSGNETIGGVKRFSENILTDINATRNVAPSTTQYGGIGIRDNANNLFASMVAAMDTNKNAAAFLRVYNPSNTSTSDAVYMSLHYNADGSTFVTAPASDVNTSIVTTINKSKAANGYFQLGNGLIIQWGKSTTTNSEAKITLPKAFTTTNYAVVGNSTQALGNASNRYLTGWAQVIARTTTNFTMYMSNYENSNWWNDVEKPFTWIAIGY